MDRSDPLATARLALERLGTTDPVVADALRELVSHAETLSWEKARAESHLRSLVSIGQALSREKDFNALLKRIITESKAATGADAGSIYIVEDLTEGMQVLRFKYSHTFSKNLPYEERIMPLDTSSIAGYVAVTGRTLNIADVYQLTDDDPVGFNSSFDRRYNYRTKSMLVAPLRSHDDRVIGVIQLINCKDTPGMAPGASAFSVQLRTNLDYSQCVVPFPPEYINLIETIASQASIALENNRMVRQIESQFEQFVKASVHAIESRDPATSGHSFRVADTCVAVAEAINLRTDGRFKDTCFSPNQLRELEYAALLHDFGKVYIDNSVFLKAKKLYPKDFLALRLRLSLLYRGLEVEAMAANGGAPLPSLPDTFQRRLNELRRIIELVTALNEPTVTEQDPAAAVDGIRRLEPELSGRGLDGEPLHLLSDEEARCLAINRGTLTADERRIIESHVEHTYNFLDQIPWPEELKNIPDIARKHHEKLDGSGYPLGIDDPERIPLQARIMAVADIWDALAASDRPYKKALPFEKCCAILRDEATRGKLDNDVVEILIALKSTPPGPA